MLSSLSSSHALRQRTWALFALFFLPGLLMASWASRTPAIRDDLQVSIGEMGIVLFGLSLGSMSGILSSGWLVNRFGTRKVIRFAMSLVVAGILLMSVALLPGLPRLFALGLACLGAGLGASEVAVNVEGAIVERLRGKTLLPVMHGCYSFGTLIGAGVGIGLSALKLPVSFHLFAAGLTALVPLVIAVRAIPPHDSGNSTSTEQGNPPAHIPFWRDIQLLLIGVVILAMALAEGSATDWLSLLMVDGHGFSQTSGTLIYTGFTLGMTLGRFTGGWFIDRYNRVAVVRTSALLGALGIGLIVFVDNPFVAGCAVLLWGAGASLGFPLTISAASDTGPNAPARVSVVAATGYIAFLVGPPMLGYLGEHYGLRNAMVVVLALMIVAAVVARAVAKPQQAPSTTI
ncbi:MFS transporter [Mangrovibacter yixingensis]|uniref:MFS transporter n=1 Tax=Mangrovibacter yixingensis TaxID=1529639 RepID=UPI001CFB9371|nr:MFS transporter [Mangrovibacter yixingensis]